MRKNIFLSVLLALGIVASGADAAPARGNARGNNVAATQNTISAAAPVAARAGARQKVVGNTGVKTTSAPVSSAAAPMAARAGATQKVIQTGQKVNTAATNSAVPQECQDAFYGCMDSFCMLDNASGGRCQCNDKITELDAILEDILKMDKQSYTMATEGVERIQMGEAEEQVMSQAKTAAEKSAKTKTDTLAQWNSLYDQDDDDNLSAQKTNSGVVDTFINKKGDALYKSSASMCLKSSPEECKQYGKMLQLVYAQRIRSDCTAYENSLKQQKSASKQKLQTAQKALRDAATEEFKDQNKYETAGECAVEFAKCMQTTAECGSDYTGCVTLAAKENVRNNTSGTVAKQTKLKGKVAGSNITLAASTMETLLAKKEICAHVTKQCVNANKNDAVWNTFIRNAAPALKTAEELAESNLRMQCIPTLADCFKTACKSQIDPKDEQGSYDMCLSNPKTYKSLCKVQLTPCLEATGGTYEKPEDSSLWNSLIAALNSMKVDACTNQVRSCLTERCGEDFAGCVGLDTESIGLLCPVDKLTACVQDGRFSRNASDGKANAANVAEIREYVAEIAQGLAVQVDNSLLTVCEKALNDSMMKVCGDTETCDALMKDEKLGSRSLRYDVCSFVTQENGEDVTFTGTGICKSSLDQVSKEEFEKYMWAGGVSGLMYWGLIDYDFDKNMFTTPENYLAAVEKQFGKTLTDAEKIQTNNVYNEEIGTVQSAIKNAIAAIEADPTVQYCMTGREVQGFDANKIGKKGKDVSRFPNLTDQVKRTIIAYALRGAREKYDEKYNEVYEQLMQDQVKAAERIDHAKAVETAKNTCDTWAAHSVLPRSKTPENIWTWIAVAIAVAACVVASIFSGGASLALAAGIIAGELAPAMTATLAIGTATISTTVGGIIAAGAVAAGTGIAAAVSAGVGIANQVEVNKANDTIAEPARAQLDQWNYRATITTMFDPSTGECTKETIYRNCDKAIYSTGKCKRWGEEKTEVKKIKLL